ncbi:DUF445 domain-containing protein [Actinospongicola halichondriae]|uniref:DUF445 domain-containing protein n=1 Tax=Actinospongicola halichondriae TaxID=3236844 RepID=UPI003D4B8CAD
MSTSTTVPFSDLEQVRGREITAAKRRATALLALVAIAFVVAVLTTDDEGSAAYLRAGLEAAMVGGLADWFAVVAIFRHPLGIPIPHTAVIVQRKDAFGETLGEFVQQNFLNAETVGERVRAIGVSDRASAWVIDPEHAQKVAGYGAELAVRLADVVKDDDLLHMAEHEVRARIERLDVAPLAGRLLEIVTEEGRHRELVDSVLRGLDRFLEENEALLRERFTHESPWWVPDVIDDRIFNRLLVGVRAIIQGDTIGGSDELRERIDVVVARIIDRLEHDDVWRARAEVLRDELLDHPALRTFIESLWADLKETLREQAADDGSVLRGRLTDLVVSAATRFREDEALMRRADEVVESAVGAVIETFGGEITNLISSTIGQWDGEETAGRLELLLGRDLQFIRINGTIVGGLAGLAIHGVADVLG